MRPEASMRLVGGGRCPENRVAFADHGALNNEHLPSAKQIAEKISLAAEGNPQALKRG
jgi:hypothetical protein